MFRMGEEPGGDWVLFLGGGLARLIPGRRRLDRRNGVRYGCWLAFHPEDGPLFAGPIFSREALTSPRQLRHFLIRSGYVAALFVLMYTAGQAMFGWQQVRSIGDVARFGSLVFQIFSLVQLSLVLFFALLFGASGVAQEKDRGTLILLLMTDMRNHELVLGKLFAGLLMVMVLILASVPVLFLVLLLGGVGIDQVLWSLAICVASALTAGSWGLLVAYWREKTFQTLAISVLGFVILLGVVEGLVTGLNSFAGEFNGAHWAAHWIGLLNPYRVLLTVLNPLAGHSGLEPAHVSAWDFLLVMAVATLVINGITMLRLRIWNPSRSFEAPSDGRTRRPRKPPNPRMPRRTKCRPVSRRSPAPNLRSSAQTRRIWANPVVWREICTKAYGRKILVIKAAYVVVAALIAFAIAQTPTLRRTRPRHDLARRRRPGRFVPDQPDAHQCSSGDGSDVGAGRQDARAVVDDRRHGKGIHLRQAGWDFLQHQGADRHSARAGRLRVVHPGGVRTRSWRFACT